MGKRPIDPKQFSTHSQIIHKIKALNSASEYLYGRSFTIPNMLERHYARKIADQLNRQAQQAAKRLRAITR